LTLVVTTRACPVATLVTVTVAFGTTAPEESLTVPVNAPVEDDWAGSLEAITDRAIATRVAAKTHL
jgi:hypothetical protein